MSLIKPPPHLKISQWADKFRLLSTESSSEAGKFETARAIFQKEIMDSINDPTITEVVVTVKNISEIKLILQDKLYEALYEITSDDRSVAKDNESNKATTTSKNKSVGR